MRPQPLLVGVGLLGMAAVLSAGLLFRSPVESIGADGPAPKRAPWTTSKVHGSPEPPPPYRLEPAFPKLKFNEPLDAVAIPGTDRMFVLERAGRIKSFKADPAADTIDFAGDISCPGYGMAIHPKFKENGYIYITNIVARGDKVDPKGTRVSRYTVRDGVRIDTTTEKVIIEWPNGGHNGGCLRFGPDGYLYIVTGDGSGIADERKTGQDLSDLLGAMLRIDVDRADAGKAYSIPADNPFIKTPGARPEIFAYGLRQAWRFSFDPKTGACWAGEVGQDLWEMILRVEKGGNYGWSVTEGTHPFRPERPKGPTPILKPVIEHPHTEFRSITGGSIYRGSVKELHGAYIYGDFDAGKVWMFRHDSATGKVTDHRELAKSTIRLVGFAESPAGELLAIDFMGGMLHRLAANPQVGRKDNFPRKLSETGLFSSTRDLTPAAGLVPYAVNAQLWSDGATKERLIAIPGDGKIEVDTITYPQPAPGAPPGWRFPDGTVLVKTFFLEQAVGAGNPRRRLETRILHFQNLPGTQEFGDGWWAGYTYVWNDEQTDAELAPAGGLDREFEVRDPAAPGGTRKQKWHFPSRNECIGCHTQPAKFVLGVNTRQLNRDYDYGGGRVVNQLRAWEQMGMLAKPLHVDPAKLPRFHNPDDSKVDLDLRAKSYLQANCAHCHMKWGGGNAEFQLLATLDVKDMGIVGVRPNHGAFGTADPAILVPGAPERSLIYQRMNRRGEGQMPHIGSHVVDKDGVKLIHDWIRAMK